MRRLLPAFICAALLAGCSGDGDPYYAEARAGLPGSYRGREVVREGSLVVGCRDVNLDLWDGEFVDGDVVTIVVNDEVVLENYTLAKEKRVVPVRLRRGYNWVLLYAVNEGSVPPNTASVDVRDCSSTQTLALSSDLKSCGAAYLVAPD
jgi:hypothetical protein